MKNTIIGFLAGTLLILLTGQASNNKEYQVQTMFSHHDMDKTPWLGAYSLCLWPTILDWKAGDKYTDTLGGMYKKGWRLVSKEKTNQSSEVFQFTWVFEREL